MCNHLHAVPNEQKIYGVEDLYLYGRHRGVGCMDWTQSTVKNRRGGSYLLLPLLGFSIQNLENMQA